MNKKNLFIYPLLTVILVLILSTSELIGNLENKAKDLLFLIRGKKPVSDNVVLVEVGDDTFGSLNEQWPFPRTYYAKLIDNLEKAGAREIIFDIEFTEKSNAIADSILGETASKYKNIIFAGKIISTKGSDYSRAQILTPINELSKNKWGLVNITNDNDGFVRKYELFQKHSGSYYYSLGAVAASMLNPKDKTEDHKKFLKLGNRYIPKATSSGTLLNFYGPAGYFKHYDFADVLDDSSFTLPNLDLDTFDEYYEAGVFKDKIVLIGVSAVEFHDSHRTPFFLENRKLTPGLEIHASFIEMFLNNDFLKNFSYIYFMGILLILTFLFFYLNILIPPNKSIFITLLSIIMYMVAIYFAFVKSNTLIPIIELPLSLIFVYIISMIYHYLKTLNERKFIKQAFEHYLAPSLVEELIKDPKKLGYGGAQKEISVLFSDIRSFTPYSESHTAKETADILREYLTAMVDVIIKNNGTLDKFVGDEIMALYGTPVELDNHAYHACKTALEMAKKLSELKEKWKKERKDGFDIGIGVNSGFAVVGNLGSEQIFDYTGIGDTINAGARLESINKQYNTQNHIIISEATYKMAEDKLIVKYIDDVLVKGKSIPIKIYELIGLKE